MEQITKAFNAYMANCLTDNKVIEGVEQVIGRQLTVDEMVEVMTMAYKPFHKAHKLSK